MKLAGYTIKEVIYAVDDTVVARAESDGGERVVLKYQNSRHPSLDLCARWQHEHSVLESIDSEWVIQSHALAQVDHGLVLVLEDFGTANLAQVIDRQPFDLGERITLAMQLTSAISAVHQHHMIHGDVSSKNVLVDVPGLKLKLCDFGLSSRLSHEQKPSQDLQLRGTLEYMSPEQTGRTNLEVDYRSDLYSLGVTLYELFSGRTPFQSDDPMTLLHAQIAIAPTPLHFVDPTIPEPLSQIVQKLLSKSPDDRYQSSFGLHADLASCAQQWARYRRIEPIPLAAADVPERFCVAHRLYGREAEVADIGAAFERVSGGRAELLLVGGYSGIGKTALVTELHRPIVAKRGYFLRGKCDQYSRNQPFSALTQAFGQLLRQLAVEGEQRRLYWKSQLLAALGSNAAAISDLIPNLTLLIGEPPPLVALPPAENENRFLIAFAQFVQALSSSAHPLVLFLDDLQWADAATLKLIEHLVSADLSLCVLIIGAYRDNEVDSLHPLTAMVKSLENAKGPIAKLTLRNLEARHVSQLIADTLHSSISDVETLAGLCLEKTQGNPFFLGQFLSALHENGDVHYVRSEGAWRWNIASIRERGMTDNVVELMLGKLRLLSDETQQLLTLAAHLGDSFDMRQLMAVGDAPAVQIAETLWPALQAGMLVPLSEDYKFTQNADKLQAARNHFLHDRVQQAAYGLTSDAERVQLRLHSGRRLLAGSSPAELDDRLFIILEHLNPALQLITDPIERARLLELNIRGGSRAKASSSFATAVTLLRRAKELLVEDAWSRHPEQTLQLYRELAEAEYLSGNFERAERLYPEGIAASNDAIAQVTLCLVQVDQYHIEGRFSESYAVLHRALDLLGCAFPVDEEEAGAAFPDEFGKTQALLADVELEQLLSAPEMTRPESLLEMRIYFALSYSTYQTGRFSAFVVNACRMVQRTLGQGQGDLAAVGYVAYVTAMSVMGKPYTECYRMGRLALSLAEQRDNKYFRLTVYQYFPAFYQHWGEPLANTLPFLENGLELGHAGINPLSAGFCALLRSSNQLVLGTPLETLEAECERGLKFLQRSHQPNTESMLRYGVLLPAQALQGKTLHRLSFDTVDCRASDFFAADYETPTIPLALYAGAMIRHAYLMGDAPLWRQFAGKLDLVGQCLPDSPIWTEANWYVALGLLRADFAQEDQPEAGFSANQERAQTFLERFRVWAEGCRENFLHKYLLLAAEDARGRDHGRAAMDLYARAIDEAKQANYVASEALASELYANFWLSQKQNQLASHFIRDAYFHYQRWGAAAKCRLMEERWSNTVFRMQEYQQISTANTSTFRNVSEQTGLLDLHSLLKASQLLAKEIHLDSLLQKMLAVLLENAGAEHGAIVLHDEEQLIVEAEGGLVDGRRVDCQRISRKLSEYSLDTRPLLPNSLIEYARLTRTTLVLNDPASDERFSSSRYLQTRRPKSVICLPVVSQGKLVALVYLENSLMENAFTARQQQTLELLSAQAAISLVNARLYESLEEKVNQRTEELRQMSLKDGLTGIANRRYFDERLAIEWRRCQRAGQPMSLLMLDIDHFKQFNDHYGHQEGDSCITAVAQSLQQVAGRSGDVVARYGGEEFAILLPDTESEAAQRVAESCLRSLAALQIPHDNSSAGKTVSLSIGIGTLQVTDDATMTTLIHHADQALYQAKRGGRAQYRHFQEESLAE